MILPGKNVDVSKLTTETLIRNFEKLGTIFNTLREIIFTVDVEKGIIENVNNSIETLGYTKEEWEGQKFSEWPISKRKKFNALIRHAIQSTEEASSELILFPTKNNKAQIPFEFSTALFVYNKKKYYLCVLRDVSEREQLLGELRQALIKEKELNELRSMFISTASHQFRTPLTIIQSGIEIMDMYLEDLPPEKSKPFHRQFRRIQGEIERLQTLMSDVLFLGRANAHRTPFKPETQNLVAFCEDLIEKKYNSRYEDDRKILLIIKGKPSDVSFDPKLMDHVLENILSNAYKYSKEGNIAMRLEFEVNQVKISIKDNGIGIPVEDLPNLFQPFYRADNASEIAGTGLGLAIVKEYVELHNGQILVSGELNAGTTITILLPLEVQ
ncbi:ATP-binding protein [Chitinophagaceae bacterium LWZ2-11]